MKRKAYLVHFSHNMGIRSFKAVAKKNQVLKLDEQFKEYAEKQYKDCKNINILSYQFVGYIKGCES